MIPLILAAVGGYLVADSLSSRKKFAKGGGVEGGAILKSLMDTYRPLVLKKIEELEFNIKKMADEMTDAEYEEKFSKLSENKKNRVKSQIRLGESPKVALANVLFDADEVGKMAKGSNV